MNRHNFLKAFGVTAAGIMVPELIVPEKQIWALGGVPGFNAVPNREYGDDTAYVQWHIDNDLLLPMGAYDIHAPVLIRHKHNQVVSGEGATIRVHGQCEKLMKIDDDSSGVIIRNFTILTDEWTKYRPYISLDDCSSVTVRQ